MKSITLVVIDSYCLVREAIGKTMASIGFAVIGKAKNYDDLVRQLQPLVPDICLIETIAPSLKHSKVISKVRKKYPGTKIVGYTLGDNEYTAREHPGIDLFISKSCDTDVIKKRIMALAGELESDSS